MKKNSCLLLLSAFFLTSCTLKSRRAESPSEPPAVSAPVEAAPAAAATPAPLPAPTPTMEEKSEKPHPVPVAVKSESHRHAGPVSWQKALGWIKNGNNRYVKHNLRKDGQTKKDIQRLASDQKPHTIVLSCADSRVPPELVFDQKLGEIFVVRAAGEALDSATLGSIEYAVEHLGTNLILVMGHTSCGAVKAAHSTLGGADAGSPALNALVADIHPRIQAYAGKEPTPHYLKESWSNVKGVAKDLGDRSAIIRQAVEHGDLKVVEAMYDLDTGVVTFW